jgi:hypothetical protein
VPEDARAPNVIAAETWSEAVGIEFCELQLNCDSHPIRLISSGVGIEPWDPATGERS